MEIVKFKKKNNNQYSILLSDNTSLSFYDDTIIHYNLLVKKSISQEYLKEIVAFNQKYDAYYKALKLIKAKLRTEKELEQKLSKESFSKEGIGFAIDKLKKQGYLNDEVYLKSYIADQVNLTLNGPNKIKFLLKRLGFDDIDQYLTIYDDVWSEKIKKVIDKKTKANHNLSSVMLRQNIKNYLINLGYAKDMVEIYLEQQFIDDDTLILEKEALKEYRRLSRKYKDETLYNKLKYNLYKKGFSMGLIEETIKKLEI